MFAKLMQKRLNVISILCFSFLLMLPLVINAQESDSTVSSSVPQDSLSVENAVVESSETSIQEPSNLGESEPSEAIEGDDSLSTQASMSFSVNSNGHNFKEFADGTRRYLFLPKDVNLSNLTISYSGSVKKVERNSTDITSQCVDTAKQTITCNFSNANNTSVDENNSIKVTDSSGAVVKVIIMKSNTPSMLVDLNGVSLNELNSSSKDNKYEGNTVSVIDPENASYNFTSTNDVEIKGRGNSTWGLAKKPYQIKFTEKTSVLGMDKGKKWVLLANHTDGSLLRNTTSYDLAEAIGMKYAFQSEYVDLWIDGNYQGNYLVCEKIDVNKSSVALNDDYGVLVELDNTYGPSEDYNFQASKSGSYFVLKESKADDVEEPGSKALVGFNSVFYKQIQNFESALYANNKDWNKIKSYIDVQSFIDYYLIGEFGASHGAVSSSFYMYQDGANDTLHLGPVWDCDLAYGNNEMCSPNEPWITSLRKSHSNTWYVELMKIPEFKAQLNATYRTKFGTKAALTIEQDKNVAKEQSASAAMNFSRWNILGKSNPLSSHGSPLASTYDGNVKNVTTWITQRLAYFDSTFGKRLLLGDCNNDNQINSADALVDLQHSVKIVSLTGDNFTRGDVDLNNSINSADALKILQYSVQIISDF